MIDTLQLELRNWRVKDHSKLTLQPAAVCLESGEEKGKFALWETEAGDLMSGSKAFYNDDLLNVTVQSLNGVPRVFVKASLPKLVHGENFQALTRHETERALETVAEKLDGIGFACDLDEAKLSRLDLFKNVESDEGFGSYQTLFSLLSGSRLHKRDYGTTFLWANGSRQLTVYDKKAEMELKGLSTASLPQNVLRFETRFLKHRKILSSVQLDTVKDLRRGFDALPEIHRNEFEDSLFSFSVPELERLSENRLLGELSYYRRHAGRLWLNAYLQDVGAVNLLERAGSVEVLRSAVSRLYDSKNSSKLSAWRLVKKIQQAQQRRLPTVELWNKKTLADLYLELRQKLLLKAA